MIEKQVTEEKHIRFLFLLCWISYFTAYLGRLNFSALVTDIVYREGFSLEQTGMIATGFFFSYGIGQVINGFLGDTLPPKLMVFLGLSVSGLANLGMGLSKSTSLMLVLWCINGVAQSMIWSPLLRVLSSWLPEERREKAYMDMAATYAVATLVTYLFSALMTSVSSWRSVFVVASFLLVAVSVVWYLSIEWLDRRRVPVEVDIDVESSPSLDRGEVEYQPFVVIPMLLLLGISLMAQGVLKDGVFTWVPTYISDSFATSPSFSILLTTSIPLINLGGLYLIRFLQNKRNSNEIVTSIVLFGISATATFSLYFVGNRSLLFALLAFAIITSCMMGINTFYVSFLPSYFVRFGRVSTVSGLLNFSVYIGSGISGYGIGSVAQSFGWNTLILGLALVGIFGLLFSLAALPFWNKFSTSIGLSGENNSDVSS